MNFFQIIILIFIILVIFLYLIIFEPNININDLFKINYIKKNNIDIKKKFFIIKKENIKNKHFYKSENVLLYPGFKKNTIEVGDILFDDKTFALKKAGFVPKLIAYIQNNKLTHVALVNSFQIDNKNVNNFEIPDGYELVNPIIIQSSPKEFNKLSSKKNLQSNQFIGKTTLYDHLQILENSVFQSFRYKNLNDEVRKNIYDMSNFFEYVQWNESIFLELPVYRIYSSIMSFVQKMFNLDYYNFFKKTKLFYLNNINLNIFKNNLIDPEQIIKLNNKIKFFIKKMNTDKKNKDKYFKLVKKLLIVKSKLKKKNKMVCSHFIHHIYKINNIDLLSDNSFGIKNINYSKLITPKDLSKIIFDNRFKYIATFS